jgi:tetratricopeptide (TPR) repeat protein
LSTAPQNASPSQGQRPAIQALRVHVAGDVAIVAEGDTDARFAEKLRAAVESDLGRRGVHVASSGEKSADLTVRIETRVKGAVYFLRGHLGLTAERGATAIATATTEDEIHREAEFPTVMAEKAVSALLGSPAFVEFAESRFPSQRPATRRAAPRVAARPQPIVAKAPSPEAEAKAHYGRGTSFYNLGRFSEAQAEYEAAYLAVQDPPFLFNIAQCQRQMGRRREAIATYRSYLRAAPNAPNRIEVQRRIADLERETRATALDR